MMTAVTNITVSSLTALEASFIAFVLSFGLTIQSGARRCNTSERGRSNHDGRVGRVGRATHLNVAASRPRRGIVTNVLKARARHLAQRPRLARRGIAPFA